MSGNEAWPPNPFDNPKADDDNQQPADADAAEPWDWRRMLNLHALPSHTPEAPPQLPIEPPVAAPQPRPAPGRPASPAANAPARRPTQPLATRQPAGGLPEQRETFIGKVLDDQNPAPRATPQPAYRRPASASDYERPKDRARLTKVHWLSLAAVATAVGVLNHNLVVDASEHAIGFATSEYDAHFDHHAKSTSTHESTGAAGTTASGGASASPNGSGQSAPSPGHSAAPQPPKASISPGAAGKLSPVAMLYEGKYVLEDNVSSDNVLGASHTQNGHNDGRGSGWANGVARMYKNARFLIRSHVGLVGFQEFEWSVAKRTPGIFKQAGHPYGIWPLSKKNYSHDAIGWDAARYRMVHHQYVSIRYFSGSWVKVPLVVLEDLKTHQKFWMDDYHNPAETHSHHNQGGYRHLDSRIEAAVDTNITKATGLPGLSVGDGNDHGGMKGHEPQSYNYCEVTDSGLMHHAAGGSNGPGQACHTPKQRTIDDIFGTIGTIFSGFKAHKSIQDQEISDHPITTAHFKVVANFNQLMRRVIPGIRYVPPIDLTANTSPGHAAAPSTPAPQAAAAPQTTYPDNRPLPASEKVWERDVHADLIGAAAYVQQLAQQPHGDKQLAINLDVDNTSAATQWDYNRADPDALRLARAAHRAGVAVLFNTGRFKNIKGVGQHLRQLGFPVDGIRGRLNSHEPLADSKQRVRAIYNQRYDIIADIGNNTTDFIGKYTGRKFRLPNYRKTLS